jgi:hypothetical protein
VTLAIGLGAVWFGAVAWVVGKIVPSPAQG